MFKTWNKAIATEVTKIRKYILNEFFISYPLACVRSNFQIFKPSSLHFFDGLKV